MPIPKYKVLRAICKSLNVTPCKMKKILKKNEITSGAALSKTMHDKYATFVGEGTANYIVMERDYLY